MSKRCGHGKTGMTQQKRLLTYLMRGMSSASSPCHAENLFHQRVESARQKFSTPHKLDELMESINEKPYVYSADLKTGEK